MTFGLLAIGIPLADTNGPLGGAFLTLGVLVLWVLLPGIWMSGIGRGSPGKRALKLVVVGTDGRPIGFGRGVERQFVLLIGALLLYIGWLWALWDPKRQALHDKAARSLVVHRSASTAEQPVPELGLLSDSCGGDELPRLWLRARP